MARTLHSQNDIRRHLSALATMRGAGRAEEWQEAATGAAVLRALQTAMAPADVTTHILDHDSWRPDAARVREVIAELDRAVNARASADRSGCRACDWGGWRAGWTHRRTSGQERIISWLCPCTCDLGRHIATARTTTDPPRPAHPDADRVRSDLMAAPVVPLLGPDDGLLGWWMQAAGDPWKRPPLVGPLADAPASPARVGSWQKAAE